jgi:hypothetical protein
METIMEQIAMAFAETDVNFWLILSLFIVNTLVNTSVATVEHEMRMVDKKNAVIIESARFEAVRDLLMETRSELRQIREATQKLRRKSKAKHSVAAVEKTSDVEVDAETQTQKQTTD